MVFQSITPVFLSFFLKKSYNCQLDNALYGIMFAYAFQPGSITGNLWIRLTGDDALPLTLKEITVSDDGEKK
jgi:hypothetical protein